MARALLRASIGPNALELVGALPDLPQHIAGSAYAQYRVESQLPLTLLVLSSTADQLLEISPGHSSTAVLFEFHDYDIYWECIDGSVIDSPDYPDLLELTRVLVEETGRSVRHYRLRLRNDVGIITFRVLGPAESILASLEFEVFPKKLNYHTDYRAILADTARIAHNLIFDVLARTALIAGLVDSVRVTTTEWYRILSEILEALLHTIDEIHRDPQRSLEAHDEWVRWESARQLGPDALERAMRSPGNAELAVKGVGIPTLDGTRKLWPRYTPERRHVSDFDTPENRFLRWVLSDIHSRLAKIRFWLRSEQAEESDATAWQKFAQRWASEAEELLPRVKRRLQFGFISDAGEYQAGPLPIAFKTHPLYSRAFQLAQALRRGLSTETLRFTRIGSKPIWLLYEYWCYLAILDLLRSHSELIQTNVVQLDFQGSRIVLTKGVEAAVYFRHKRTGKRLRVIYNRLYPTPTTWQKPDTAIHIESDSDLHVFDAKYRIQFDSEYVETYGGVGPHVDDINTMHRYRDAIVNPALPHYPRLVRGAYVLFPYDDSTRFQTHRFFRSASEVGIGAFPFLPSCTDLVSQKLSDIVESAIGQP